MKIIFEFWKTKIFGGLKNPQIFSQLWAKVQWVRSAFGTIITWSHFPSLFNGVASPEFQNFGHQPKLMTFIEGSDYCTKISEYGKFSYLRPFLYFVRPLYFVRVTSARLLRPLYFELLSNLDFLFVEKHWSK